MSTAQKELWEIITRLTEAQQKKLLNFAQGIEDDDATPDEIAEIEAGKAEIDRGEWSDWEEVKNELAL